MAPGRPAPPLRRPEAVAELGQMLYFHLSLLQQAQAAKVLIAMFGWVLLVDSVSAHVRRGLAPAHA